MIATVDHIDTTVRVRLNIEDGPVLTKRYGKRKFRVDTVAITYWRRGADRWRTQTVEVHGPYVLKNGSDGQDRNTDFLHGTRDLAESGFVALVEQHRPAS